MTHSTATPPEVAAQEAPASSPLQPDELRMLDAYWRAANYLSVGQIYLCGNPLLREPLTLAHVKPRLLGHWGTTPGLNFIYAHMNRAIRARDLDAIFIAGPGHGGPGVVANTYLEGPTARSTRTSAATSPASRACSRSSPFPAAFRATPRPRRRAPSTKVESSATPCCTPMARCSTIPACSPAA